MEAANHNAKRRAADCLRSSGIKAAIARPRTSVDCHRWSSRAAIMPGSFSASARTSLFGLLHFFQGQLAGFDQVGHHRLAAAAEQSASRSSTSRRWAALRDTAAS